MSGTRLATLLLPMYLGLDSADPAMPGGVQLIGGAFEVVGWRPGLMSGSG